MQLFRFRTSAELLDEFLQENYISIDLPWLKEDVEYIAWEQLCASYEQAGGNAELRLFLYEMQDEDLLIVTDGERAYLGDLGDYYFVEPMLDEQTTNHKLPPRLHRRGVTWLKPLELDAIMAVKSLQPLMAAQQSIAKFTASVSLESFEKMLNEPTVDSSDAVAETIVVDAETIKEAIEILKQALRSNDAGRRERAAIALLAYAKK